MHCMEFEILLADFLDGTLPGDRKIAAESHLTSCAACAALARDAAEAVAFMERATELEPPVELVNRLLFEVSNGRSKDVVRPPLIRRLFGEWAEPLLQPRLAMGMAMTMLSLAMLFRVAGIEERQLKPSDLDPVKVWSATEDRVMRVWARGVKYYENLRVVYEIQSRIEEWKEDEPQAAPTSSPVTPREGTR